MQEMTATGTRQIGASGQEDEYMRLTQLEPLTTSHGFLCSTGQRYLCTMLDCGELEIIRTAA